MTPVFPEENEEEEASEEESNNDQENDKMFMINGIETKEYGNSNENILTKKKKLTMTHNAEETKINFFDPN